MGDYFDDDDLIADAIADADDGPPPPDEYDDFDEGDFEAVGMNAHDTNNINNDNNNTNTDNNNNDEENDYEDNYFDNQGNTNDDSNATNNGVPKSISTLPTAIPAAAAATATAAWHNNDTTPDLYGMERYSGLSSWRTNRHHPASSAANSHGKQDEEAHGATTMEATEWKKKTRPVRGGEKKDNNDNNEDDDSMDNDDLDNGRTRSKRPNAGEGGGGGYTGSSGRGAEAQLVRFREREEEEVLGRSWGKLGGRTFTWHPPGRFLSSKDHFTPQRGEDSVAVTLANGTRTYVKQMKQIVGGVLKDNNGETTNAQEGESSMKEKKEAEDCLLGLPMSELIRRADIIQKRAIKRKLEREEQTLRENESNNDNNDAMEQEEEDGDDVDVPTKQNRIHHETQRQNQVKQQRREMQLQQRLWVDKHAPTSISHLLSDERTNREVLRALRGWDPYVFKREAPKRPAFVSSYGNNNNNNNNNKNNNNKNNNNYNGATSNKNYGMGKKEEHGNSKENDDGDGGGGVENARVDVRPDERSRVILISGPPGVGKSTLAHIVCRHAGYRAIEVNASDERSAPALTERVTRAMESSTLKLGDNEESSNKAGKPNCIILDEVDGADAKSAIAALVDIIRADIPPASSKGGSSKGKKGRAARTTYLRRPIILICNHKHAPALRPILPYAKQFDVQPPNPERLTSRLRAVLAAEHMTAVAGSMLLHRLVAATGGDVRSCLYALQFASARARELAVRKLEREGGDILRGGKGASIMVDISSTLMSALGDSGNGMKDMQSDVSSTVATVFRKGKYGKSNKRQKTSSSGAFGSTANPKGVDIVLKAVDHFGDNSKTLDCLFMNVNRVSYVDPTLDRCSLAFEWLSEADTYRSHKSNVAMNNSAEHHSMQKFYIPSAAAAIHLLCCVETRPDLTFSTRPLSDLHYQNQANVSLVHRFVEGLAPRARRGIGGGTDVVVSDVIPYGLWLLSAGEGKNTLSRPVSSVDILSAEEKLAFSAHVATLRALGLTYVKEDVAFNHFKSPHTSDENIRLEPDIDRLVRFEDVGDGFALGRQDIPPLLKELLAHGATLAALRERESEAKAHETVEKPKEAVQPKEDTLTTKIHEKLMSTKPEKVANQTSSNSQVAKNFLGVRAAKAKEAKTARRAERVGFDRSKKIKLSNTGSGVELSKVVRFKYQRGFTQAVRASCQLEDLL